MQKNGGGLIISVLNCVPIPQRLLKGIGLARSHLVLRLFVVWSLVIWLLVIPPLVVPSYNQLKHVFMVVGMLVTADFDSQCTIYGYEKNKAQTKNLHNYCHPLPYQTDACWVGWVAGSAHLF